MSFITILKNKFINSMLGSNFNSTQGPSNGNDTFENKLFFRAILEFITRIFILSVFTWTLFVTFMMFYILMRAIIG